MLWGVGPPNPSPAPEAVALLKLDYALLGFDISALRNVMFAIFPDYDRHTDILVSRVMSTR